MSEEVVLIDNQITVVVDDDDTAAVILSEQTNVEIQNENSIILTEPQETSIVVQEENPIVEVNMGGGSSIWGKITGDISEQLDLQTELGNKADANHNHDLIYASITHDHDLDYSDISHNHDLIYANITHDHDLNYSDINHNHDLIYASTTHDHDLDYSDINHNHDLLYSSINHDHDLDYSGINHDHNLIYASITHNHDLDYSDINHSHGGLLPTGGSASQVLSKIDGTDYNTQWITPSSSGGDVFGPASSLNNSIATYDGVTGKLLKDSSIYLKKVNSSFSITPEAPGTYEDYSVVIGSSITTAKLSSVAIGRGAKANDNYSVAIGRVSFAEGVAIGSAAESKNGGTAVGENSKATGGLSIGIGTSGEGSGNFSVAIGNSSIASGSGSTCIGYYTSSSHLNSTAIGKSSATTKSNQMVLGGTNIVETLLRGDVIMDSGKYITGQYKSSDGTVGLTATKTFTTTEGTHTVVIKNGLITSWDIA